MENTAVEGWVPVMVAPRTRPHFDTVPIICFGLEPDGRIVHEKKVVLASFGCGSTSDRDRREDCVPISAHGYSSRLGPYMVVQ